MSDKTGSGRAKREERVYLLHGASRCHGCDTRLPAGSLAKLKKREDEAEVLCRVCSGLERLEVLLSGDALLTKLATKYSTVRYVVVKWDEMWKSYERQGILVEPEAIERARREIAAAR